MPAPDNLTPDPAREEAIRARCEAANKWPDDWGARTDDAFTLFAYHARSDVPYLLAQLAQARQRAEKLEARVRVLLGVVEGAAAAAGGDVTPSYHCAAGSWSNGYAKGREEAADAVRALAGPDAGKGVGDTMQGADE